MGLVFAISSYGIVIYFVSGSSAYAAFKSSRSYVSKDIVNIVLHHVSNTVLVHHLHCLLRKLDSTTNAWPLEVALLVESQRETTQMGLSKGRHFVVHGQLSYMAVLFTNQYTTGDVARR